LECFSILIFARIYIEKMKNRVHKGAVKYIFLEKDNLAAIDDYFLFDDAVGAA
jgi:hypothetical protein